jgi:hypothetical protein
MTINKSQGQTLSTVGLYLKNQFLPIDNFMLMFQERHLEVGFGY